MSVRTDVFADLLLAPGPDPAFEQELALFGRLVGVWDVVGTNLAPDGTVRAQNRGEWHFAWALRGRAIIDLLISPPLAEQPAGPFFEYGPTIRVYDPGMGAWRVTFNPTGSIGTIKLVARPDGGGGILMEGRLPPEDRQQTRWSFTGITQDAFLWQERDLADDGETWVLSEEIRATRRA